jgi:hypothetical protein
MSTHELKTWPEYWTALDAGAKTFELRRNDRDFQPGDTLVLREWNPDSEEYTGRSLTRRVSYVLRDGEKFGVQPDFAVLGLQDRPEPKSWRNRLGGDMFIWPIGGWSATATPDQVSISTSTDGMGGGLSFQPGKAREFGHALIAAADVAEQLAAGSGLSGHGVESGDGVGGEQRG